MILKTAIALAVSLIGTIALMTLTAIVLSPHNDLDHRFEVLVAVQNITFLALTTTLPCIAVIAPFWFAIFRLFRTRRLIWHLALGAVMGAICGGVAGVLATLDVGGPAESYFQMMAVGAIFGIIGAAIFWLIRRPDRDAPANPASTGS